MKKQFILLLSICIISASTSFAGVSANTASTSSNYVATLKTSFGDIEILLYNATPIHRDNFIKKIKQKVYNEIKFHRIIKDFMIQAGDHRTKFENYPRERYGTSSHGDNINPEFADGLIHTRGAVGMAREEDRSNPKRVSSGSQFYIISNETGISTDRLNEIEARIGKKYSLEQRENYINNGGAPHLDYEYVVFGHVIKGMDIVKKISDMWTNRNGLPHDDILIKKVTVKKVRKTVLAKKYNYK